MYIINIVKQYSLYSSSNSWFGAEEIASKGKLYSNIQSQKKENIVFSWAQKKSSIKAIKKGLESYLWCILMVTWWWGKKGERKYDSMNSPSGATYVERMVYEAQFFSSSRGIWTKGLLWSKSYYILEGFIQQNLSLEQQHGLSKILFVRIVSVSLEWICFVCQENISSDSNPFQGSGKSDAT